jgi:dihydroneopterin aldolase/2-amino-4-hydroxy-6-hydroxymethyldihydropteridine diphosphokinase
MSDDHVLVTLEGVKLSAHLGCLDEEHGQSQEIRLDIDLTVASPKEDSLAQVVDYRAVLATALEVVGRQHWNLLESLCCEIAHQLLLRFPKLIAVKVRVHTPEAPLGIPFTDLFAETTLTRDSDWPVHEDAGPMTALVALGSNLGDRQETMRRALRGLGRMGFVRACSSLYATEPVGMREQPAFLNAVVRLESNIPPGELLARLKTLEADLGRKPALRWGPRVIDLDLLFYGDQVLQQDDLVIPHPRLHERGFVLFPLLEVAGDFLHPVFRQTVAELWLHWLEEEEVVWVQGPGWVGEIERTVSFRLPPAINQEDVRAKLTRHAVPAEAQLRILEPHAQ